MKGKRIFVIIAGLVASIGLGFTPALADVIDPETRELIYPPDEDIQIEEPGENERQDESFGDEYQVTWITTASFSPRNSLYTYGTFSNVRHLSSGSSIPGFFEASINLPSGARLASARMYFRDTDADENIRLWIRRRSPASESYTTLCQAVSSGTPGYFNVNCSIGTTIANANYMYEAMVGVYDATTGLGIIGVRLFWRRQVRPSLPNPFCDIGHLSTGFQRAIIALEASGITSGTGGCNFSPSDNVTRAQMAVFLAKALGLYWSYSDGY